MERNDVSARANHVVRTARDVAVSERSVLCRALVRRTVHWLRRSSPCNRFSDRSQRSAALQIEVRELFAQLHHRGCIQDKLSILRWQINGFEVRDVRVF